MNIPSAVDLQKSLFPKLIVYIKPGGLRDAVVDLLTDPGLSYALSVTRVFKFECPAHIRGNFIDERRSERISVIRELREKGFRVFIKEHAVVIQDVCSFYLELTIMW